jgi:hypothetical protein
MTKDNKSIKPTTKKTLSPLKKRAKAPNRSKEEISPRPVYPLFTRIQIQTQRQARNLIARILKLLLNGDLLESRAREARLYIETAILLNRELQLRDRLDKVCEMLKIAPEPEDQDGEQDDDKDIPQGAGTNGSE